MAHPKRISYDLIGQTLSKDVFSERGLLLITEGTRLHERDITMLMNQGVFTVEVSENHISKRVGDQVKQWGRGEREQKLHQDYMDSLEKTKWLFHQAVNGEMPHLEQFMEQYTPMFQKVIEATYLFHLVHKIKGHDEYNYRHSLNVGLISGIIGKLIGLAVDQITVLGQMGILHDIGKLKVRDEILHKPGRLSIVEFEEMKRHTYHGYEMLRKMPGTVDIICEGALYHHERMDGSGYPKKRKGNEIPFLVQILSVADTYDAICSDRVYQRKASPYFAVRELMKEAYDGRLNATITIPFIRYIMEAYVGQQAVLEDGRTAEIIFLHPEEPDRPLLRMGDAYIDMRKHRSLHISDLLLDS